MKLVYPPLVLCSSISTFLPLLACAKIIKHLNKPTKSLALLGIFFVFAAIAEITLYAFSWLGKQSAWIFHPYTFVEYILIVLILKDWHNESVVAKLMRMSIPIYIFCFVLIKALGLESFETGLHNNITRPLAVLLLSAFAFLTLQTLWRQSPANLTSDYRFWMLFAMVLYYGTSLVLSAFMFTKNHDLLDGLFKIHAVANITRNLLFTIGVFQLRKAQQPVVQ